MSDFMISFFAGIGFGGWAYSKLHRNTGGNIKSALTGAGIGGAIVFLAMLTLLNSLF